MTDATEHRAAQPGPGLHRWQERFYLAMSPCPPLMSNQLGEQIRLELTALGYEDVFVSVDRGNG